MNDVTMVYDNGTRAVNKANLRIDEGEFVFLVGASGSGKTTMIKLLTAEVRPTEGRVLVNNYNIGEMKKRQIPYLRRTLGVVFQDFRLLNDRNVYENVAFAQRIVETPVSEIRRNVPAILATVGLAGKYKAKTKQLSGGEQQRVAIARAIAKNPKILLCDEPTGALDYNTGKQVLQILQDMSRQKGATVIIVTHNAAIAPIADRVIHMHDARVSRIEENPNPKKIADIEW